MHIKKIFGIHFDNIDIWTIFSCQVLEKHLQIFCQHNKIFFVEGEQITLCHIG